jgi:hypothetical protein
MCGDSTDAGSVALLIMEKRLLMQTDPPFGIAYVKTQKAGQSTTHEDIENDDLDGEKLQAFIEQRSALRFIVE